MQDATHLLYEPTADDFLAECAGDVSRALILCQRWNMNTLLRNLCGRHNTPVPTATYAQSAAQEAQAAQAAQEAQAAQAAQDDDLMQTTPVDSFAHEQACSFWIPQHQDDAVSAPNSPLADTMTRLSQDSAQGAHGARSESPPALQVILGPHYEDILQADEDDDLMFENDDTSRFTSSPIDTGAWPSYDLQFQTAMDVLSSGLQGDNTENHAPSPPRNFMAAQAQTPRTRRKPSQPASRTFPAVQNGGYAAGLLGKNTYAAPLF